jgi:hypothetical protein
MIGPAGFRFRQRFVVPAHNQTAWTIAIPDCASEKVKELSLNFGR